MANILLDMSVDLDQVVFGLVRNTTKDEVIDFIMNLDSQACEIEFTEDLIRRLAVSLKADSAESSLDFIDWEKVK